MAVKLPPLPAPELTCWYGPSSEFYEEPMFSADQLRERDRQIVELCAQIAAQQSSCFPNDSDYTRGYALARQAGATAIRKLLEDK